MGAAEKEWQLDKFDDDSLSERITKCYWYLKWYSLKLVSCSTDKRGVAVNVRCSYYEYDLQCYNHTRPKLYLWST